MPLTPDILRKYRREVFVETGTFTGGGIEAALAVGFQKVITIELSSELARRNQSVFGSDPRVTLLVGSSESLLVDAIKGLDVLCTFWLDAHYSGGQTAGGHDGASRHASPVLEELKVLGSMPAGDHVILVDDIRMFRSGSFYVASSGLSIGLSDVQDAILAIDGRYRFSFEPSEYDREDILAAVISN